MTTIYKPGDEVPNSGIYKVIHHPNHAREHEVVAIVGEHFPPCHHCGHHPRFELVRAANHISTSPEFHK